MIDEYSNFIDIDYCDNFISLAENKFEPAKTIGRQIEGYRVADSCWLMDNEKGVLSYKEKVSSFLNLPLENMENLHIVRYQVGGEYKKHQDFFHPGESYYENVINRGGQRTHSVLLYLNDDFTGGETDFPKLQIKVKPEKGKMIVWTNLNEDGTLDYDSIHAGLPVITGVKYIATIWIRESKFISLY